MLAYVSRRLLESVPVLLLGSIIVFGLLRAMPGDPAVIMAGTDATQAQIDAITRRYELDRPLTIQYVKWLSGVVRGDFGVSYVSNRPIAELIIARLPATIHLAVSTIIVVCGFGFPLGILAAVRPNSVLARIVDIYSAVAIAIPSFWLGLLLLLFVAVRLRWLPTSGFVSITEDPVASVRHLILPSISMGAEGLAILIRFLKSSMMEVAGSDFIRTARAKGLREVVVVTRHVLKVAMLPVVTILGIQLGYLLGGAVVTEAIFGLPGLGRLLIDALGNQQYLVIQNIVLIFIVTFVVMNILVDVAVATLDPRIRLER